MIFWADMAFQMSNYDDQISWKLAQRKPFVFAIYSRNFVFLANQDDFFGSPLRLFSVGIFCGIFPSFWHTTRFGTEILRERKKSIIRSQLKLGWKNWEKTTKKMGRSFKYKVRNEMKMDCFMTNVLKKSYLFECWLMLFQEITYAGTWTCNWTCTWLVYDLLYCANLI